MKNGIEVRNIITETRKKGRVDYLDILVGIAVLSAVFSFYISCF